MKQTKLQITVCYSLNELKEKYRQYCGIPKGEKILKEDIASWLSNLVESDIQDLDGDDDWAE